MPDDLRNPCHRKDSKEGEKIERKKEIEKERAREREEKRYHNPSLPFD